MASNMASSLSDDIRYVKLMLFLMKGGTFVAKKHILRISQIDKKCIDDYLNENEDDLKKAGKKKIITAKQMQLLFPGPTDLECWDISLLSYILLNLLGNNLEGYEQVALKNLRDKRNQLAHAASTSISEVQFLIEWGKLQSILLNDLSIRLSSHERNEINDIANHYLTIQDIKVASTELKAFEWIDDFLLKVRVQLESNDKELKNYKRKAEQLEQELRSITKRLKTLEDKMEIQQEINVKMDVNASTPEIKETARAELLHATKSCVSRIEDTTVEHDQTVEGEVQIAANNLFSNMSDQGVVITKVERGSILITCRCPTVSALKKIMLYFEDRMYKERLIELENALSRKVHNPIELKIDIVLETVYSALEQICYLANIIRVRLKIV